jgi:hypothetical protein
MGSCEKKLTAAVRENSGSTHEMPITELLCQAAEQACKFQASTSYVRDTPLCLHAGQDRDGLVNCQRRHSADVEISRGNHDFNSLSGIGHWLGGPRRDRGGFAVAAINAVSALSDRLLYALVAALE